MASSTRPGFFNTRRGRILRENLTAYAFLLPAGIIIFLFHLFPVAFAFFVSLYRWRRFPDQYQGLDNYVKSLGNFAYVAFAWIAIASLVYAGVLLYRLWRDTRDDSSRRIMILSGIPGALTVLLFIRYFFILLPVILDIPQRLRGVQVTRELFMGEFFASFQYPEVVEAGNLVLGVFIITALLTLIFLLLIRGAKVRALQPINMVHSLSIATRATTVFVFVGAAFLTMQLTISEMQTAVEENQTTTQANLEKAQADYDTAEQAYTAAQAAVPVQGSDLESIVAALRAGTTPDAPEATVSSVHTMLDAADALLVAQNALQSAKDAVGAAPVWVQVILISVGAVLLIVAYVIWRSAARQEDRRFILMALVAVVLMTAAYILIAELPSMIGQADRDLWQGFRNTVFFSLGTVPLQLAFGMVLAYMLFQNIKGRAFFRIVYFLPYIMPFVATSAVFRILFSHNEMSPVNQVIGLLGIGPQKWLLEPTGINRLVLGPSVPQGGWLEGPSLALIVIILYSAWTYIGYSAVIFLAGLGNIQDELYEVARIDGASKWKEFRHITFPLLSPTTFFLSMIAVIGTFKAFTQIYIMRSPAAQSSVDTASLYIFDTLRTRTDYGYGSAMAFVLFAVILALTLFQNRYMGRRVFYG